MRKRWPRRTVLTTLGDWLRRAAPEQVRGNLRRAEEFEDILHQVWISEHEWELDDRIAFATRPRGS